MGLKKKLLIGLMSSYVKSSRMGRKRKYRGYGKALAITVGGACAAYAAGAAVRQWLEYDLKGKTVLITGGSRGLGLVLARRFAREGARVAICARDRSELQRAALELAQFEKPALAIPCDLTEPAQVESMVSTVRESFGQIDVLINNAGTISVGPAEVMTLEDYEEAMKTIYWASLYTILSVLPEMRERQDGRIVNISSIGGLISVPHLVPYSAGKFALTGLSRGLHAELKKDGITVTTIYPGLMRTGSPRNATFKGQHRDEYAWFSISDALPLTSMSAERAARRIVTACKRGETEVVLSIQAKVAAIFNGLFPGATSDLLGYVNRLLPGPGGIGEERAKGAESESSLSPSWLTKLSDQAAKRNNQIH